MLRSLVLKGVNVLSVKDRDRIRDQVLQLSTSDARVVAGAVVGSLALGV